MINPEDYEVVCVLHVGKINPNELAAFTDAMARIRAARIIPTTDGTLTWGKRKPKAREEDE